MHYAGQGCAQGQRCGSSSHRVFGVVPPGHAQRKHCRAVLGMDLHGPVVSAPLGLALHVGWRRVAAAQDKTQHLARTGHLPPQRGEAVVGRDHHRASGPQRVDDAAVFKRHRLHAGHELLMFALRVVDKRHRGCGQRGQQRHFARVIHAQLHHAHAVPLAVVLAQAQQRERQADVVVEVALRGKSAVALPGAQDARHHLRDRRFAVAACHCRQRQMHAVAPGAGQHLQGLLAVLHHQTRQPVVAIQTVLDQCGCRACGLGLRQIVMCVVQVTAQCDKKVASTHAARIAVHTQQRSGAVAHQS